MKRETHDKGGDLVSREIPTRQRHCTAAAAPSATAASETSASSKTPSKAIPSEVARPPLVRSYALSERIEAVCFTAHARKGQRHVLLVRPPAVLVRDLSHHHQALLFHHPKFRLCHFYGGLTERPNKLFLTEAPRPA